MTTLLAAGLAEQARIWGEAGQHVIEKAKAILATLILPSRITKYEIERYYRKAHRVGAWRCLPKETRVLLQVARKTIKNKVKSPILYATLVKIFLKIELHTLKARAILTGIIKLLTQGKKPALGTFSLSTLLVLGLNSKSWLFGW